MTAALALLLLQSGLNPATGAMPDLPEELRNRTPRGEAVQTPAQKAPARLAQCLIEAEGDPKSAMNRAQAWREGAQGMLELAQTSHCLGSALVVLGRYDEARTAFEMASDEAPIEEPAYRARLAGMAGNAALLDGRADLALPLLAGAIEHARPASDAVLSAGLMVDQSRALVMLERLDDAGAALAAARGADPANAEAWLLSATLARRQERLAEAQGMIEYAATLAPRDQTVALEAGVIAALGGRNEAARASFSSVLALAPDSEEAVAARAYLAQLGQ